MLNYLAGMGRSLSTTLATPFAQSTQHTIKRSTASTAEDMSSLVAQETRQHGQVWRSSLVLSSAWQLISSLSEVEFALSVRERVFLTLTKEKTKSWNASNESFCFHLQPCELAEASKEFQINIQKRVNYIWNGEWVIKCIYQYQNTRHRYRSFYLWTPMLKD